MTAEMVYLQGTENYVVYNWYSGSVVKLAPNVTHTYSLSLSFSLSLSLSLSLSRARALSRTDCIYV